MRDGAALSLFAHSLSFRPVSQGELFIFQLRRKIASSTIPTMTSSAASNSSMSMSIVISLCVVPHCHLLRGLGDVLSKF